MPDSLKKRGKHPQDLASFHPDQLENLLAASGDFAWLKSQGYADRSSLKLVGDRYQLNARQRTAVARSTCSDEELASRHERRVLMPEIEGRIVHIDGFNLLTTIEASLGNGILLVGRDGCLRDMSSMHGNYRVLDDTDEAIVMIHTYLTRYRPDGIWWLLDQPVSNSGRLRAKILDLAKANDALDCEVTLVPDPDRELKLIPLTDRDVIITADSGILNHCGQWVNAARDIVEQQSPISEDRILIDFSGGEPNQDI